MPTGILIIEDEFRLARNIQVYLERSGFVVRKTDNGLDGLDEFRRFAPEIVLLDLGLPDLDGIEVLRRLIRIDSRTKVVIMTGTGLEDDQRAAINAGAQHCLVKPLVLKELRLVLENAAEG
jgi:DNA-binding response OmpR family regulator